VSDTFNAIADFFQNLFSPIVDVLGAVLLYFHTTLGAPWWLSIAMLTVVVRTVLFPLTVKQVKSMRAMQDLRPEMERIRAQYRDNRQKQQEEIMKLYQERKVNPLGGCLPILVQMPIFIGIFYVIRKFGGQPGYIEPLYPSFREGGILWFQDLSHMDPYFVLPVLSALTMLAATEITAHNIDPQQRWLMRLLPIGITIFLWSFPAGLFVYWITSNLVTLAQNYVIYHHGPGRRPAGSEPGGLFSRSSGTGNGGNGARSPENRPQTDGGPGSQTGAEDDASAQAAKTAKRKRRKKKKK
jgi:YidC/Oxa1 family membrane protein insertase